MSSYGHGVDTTIDVDAQQKYSKRPKKRVFLLPPLVAIGVGLVFVFLFGGGRGPLAPRLRPIALPIARIINDDASDVRVPDFVDRDAMNDRDDATGPPPPDVVSVPGQTAGGGASASGAIAPPVAWSLPPPCIQSLHSSSALDTQCYLATRSHGDDRVCTGRSGRPLLFHTISFASELPAQAALFVYSFLATQCCDATLTVWTRPGSTTPVAASGLASLSPRVEFKELHVESEWGKVSAGLHVNASSAAWLLAQPWPSAAAAAGDLDSTRFLIDWLRILLLYSYGGLYIDLDNVFLRDFRQLFEDELTPFAPRAGVGSSIDNSVLKLAQRPDALTARLLTSTLSAHDASPDYITARLLGYGPTGLASHAFRLLSSALFDFMSIRREHESLATPEFKGLMPEFKREAGYHTFFASMDPARYSELIARFNHAEKQQQQQQQQRQLKGGAVATEDAESTDLFFGGCFSYHWRGRYGLGIPPNSWAAVLLGRFSAAAEGRCDGAHSSTTLK